MGKDSSSATDDMTVTHATVRHLMHWVEDLGHKLFMDNFFIAKTFRWIRDKENKLMQYGTAKHKRHTIWLWTKKIEIEKRRRMGTDEGRFDCGGLEGQMRSIHADQHKLTTRRRKPDIMERYKLAHGVRRQFRSYGQQLFDPRSWKKSRSPTPSLVGRLSAASTHAARLEGRTNKHWPAKASKLCCRMSSASGQC